MDLSYALDYPVITGNSPQKVNLLLRIETWPEEGGTSRKPLNIGLVIDRSGSMSGKKLNATQEAAHALIKRLTSQDILTVVAYDSSVEVICPSAPVVDIDLIYRSINSINAGGVTNLSGGWIRALCLVAEQTRKDILNRVLLLTDGQANEGVTDKAGLIDIARQYRNVGVITSTLGFGEGFNEDILTAIAREGGGHFYFIDTLEGASNAFLQEFGDVARIFGQNCEVTITPGEGIPIPEFLGNFSTQSGNAVQIKLGDVREQDLRELLFAFQVSAQPTAKSLELATVTLSYDAVRGKIGTRRHILSIKLKVDSVNSVAQPVPDVLQKMILLQVTNLKQTAIAKLDQRDTPGAEANIKKAQELLQKYSALDPEKFTRELSNLTRLVQTMEIGNGNLRKHLSSQIYDFDTQRGNYEAKPQSDIKLFVFTPQNLEILANIVDYLRTTLKSYNYKQISIEHMEFALRELFENAIEHGAQGVLSPRGEVELHLARNYAKIVVRDNGAGFDFASTLKREELQAQEESQGHIAAKRGRGLISVRRIVDTLHANARGNEITSVIRKERFIASSDLDVLMNTQGVEEVAVIKVAGFLDTNSYGKIETLFQSVLKRGIYKLIVDMSECEYISSCGAGALMGAIGTVMEHNGRMILVSPASNVKRTLDCMGLGELFPYAANIEDAKRLLL